MRVLLIKMSSLGDVVHALAGVTDAAAAIPEIEFDWVVEEAYAAIPHWHPAVRRTIVSPLRRWRKAPVAAICAGEWNRFKKELRREHYEMVLDAQGLLKSAFIGMQARGPLFGRDARSAREPAAALLYRRRCKVDPRMSEVEQLRQLFAVALGYPLPGGPAEFGVRQKAEKSSDDSPYAVFLHGAAWPAKLWPEQHWTALARHVRSLGFRVILPRGTEAEHARARKIADAAGGEVLGSLDIAGIAPVLAGAAFAVGLDTGLTHIAIAHGTPAIMLYGPSVPVYAQVASGGLINLCSTDSTKVDTHRPNTVPLAKVIEAVEQLRAAYPPGR